ncbi:hypothetical protein B0H63DRAFT_150486 [Podospora didyma]|uniref:Uncharacterized protein n=1 Tax=Podospora didyma TaxID=330526 RepID=A0AAE0NT02_9PEZI|nr:hypothetical protein B0H63DRAFT_150486 [Podospora didyma]
MQYKMSYAREQSAAAPRPPAGTGAGAAAAAAAAATAGKQSTISKQQRSNSRPAAAEGHFDPDELSRRLCMVLADQKAHAERKRRARAAAEAGSSKGAKENNSNNNHRHHPHTSESSSKSHKPAEASTDLISELRRSRSAKHSSHHNNNNNSTDATGTATGDGGEPTEYHHVPNQAAKQFARTTTVDVMRENNVLHHLSGRALKFHIEGGRTVRPVTTGAATTTTTTEPMVAPAELSRVLRYNQHQRDKALDRNQFQRTRKLEEAAQMDAERRDVVEPLHTRHTFEGELSRISAEGGGGAAGIHHQLRNPQHHHQSSSTFNARRNSTGTALMTDLLLLDQQDHRDHRRSLIMMEPLAHMPDNNHHSAVDDTTPLDELQQRYPAHEHRVDWTQSDETKVVGSSSGGSSRPKLLLSPLLRRADSLWGLRGRLAGSSSKGGGGGAASTSSPSVAMATATTAATTTNHAEKGATVSSESRTAPPVPAVLVSPKSLKGSGGFFAKFKR